MLANVPYFTYKLKIASAFIISLKGTYFTDKSN